MGIVTTPSGSKPRASGMTLVCRPTPRVRFMPMSEQSSKQLMHRMARCVNAVVLLPMTLCHGTRRNTLQFATCKRTTYTFFVSHKRVEMKGLPDGSAAFIPIVEARGLSPRIG
jgi:hypothetical protein